MPTNLLPPDDNLSDLGSASKRWKTVHTEAIETSGGTFDLAEYNRIKGMHGWGVYEDGETSPATQVLTTTPQILSIDGLGSNTNIDYLPLDIRGVGQLWSENKITPVAIGDSYNLRIDLEVAAKTGSPTYIDFVLDIGGQPIVSIPIVERVISSPKTPPYTLSVGFPIFCLTTFRTNGGEIFLSTDTGTLTISERRILIIRTSSDV